MPVISHPNLPSLERLESSGLVIRTEDLEKKSYSKHLHIGLLNLMPDPAFQATERQFVRMLACNDEFLVHLYPTSVETENRSDRFKTYITEHYNGIDDFQKRGYDGLIISGANPSQKDMTKERFWDPLIEVFEWAESNTTSIMCSCLATHAIMKAKYEVEREMRDEKAWGIFKHQLGEDHPLIIGLEDGFNGPHSHYYDFPIQAIESTDLKILASNDFAGIYLAASEDSKLVMFQGHPEYSENSLLKEYQREVNSFVNGIRDDYPPLPCDYFPSAAVDKLEEIKVSILSKPSKIKLDDDLISEIDIEWQGASKKIYDNWLQFLIQS